MEGHTQLITVDTEYIQDLWSSVDKRVDYVGFTVLPQAMSAQQGQHLGFLPSQSRGTSLLHTGLGNTTASDNEAHF